MRGAAMAPELIEAVRASWNAGLKRRDILERHGLTPGQLAGLAIRNNFHYRKGRSVVIAPDHRAAVAGRSIFRPRRSGRGEMLLKPGSYQRKLGKVITKGRWKGMPLYSLTLEERATCPRSCANWLSCYGNNMHLANREEHGERMIERLDRELAWLQSRHPAGFVVRLHLLGDFYSVEYVMAWFHWLVKFPALRVFGYTARQSDSPIGRILHTMRSDGWERFALRTSGGVPGEPRTRVASAAKLGEIVCPVQTGRTQSCATCGLCWGTQRTVVFEPHGAA